jgi:hypothetical protein
VLHLVLSVLDISLLDVHTPQLFAMSEPSNLFSLARSKLHLSVGGKDNCSLHRWVLLKNSIVQSSSVTATAAVTCCPNPVYSLVNGEEDDPDEEVGSEESDSFMFPDAGKLVGGHTAVVNSSEADWLDSLLETLGDEDEDEFTVDSDAHVSIIPVDDDDDQLLFSPMVSPMSSSDDLSNQSPYITDVSYPYPYPVPYPPFNPPLNHSYDSQLSFSPAPYEDPLPCQDLDDSENLSVPDAIEDTSDDESDTPLTPSIRSTASISPIDAASVPLPAERSRLRHTHPHIYVDETDSYFYPFDPLPFPEEHFHSYTAYQEC